MGLLSFIKDGVWRGFFFATKGTSGVQLATASSKAQKGKSRSGLRTATARRRMLHALDEWGIADETLVVFTSDHGEWLGEHLRYGKGYPGHDCISRVPLLMRVPGAKGGRRISGLVEGVDVVPTLLDACGVPAPPHLQGQSLWPVLRGGDAPDKEVALMEATDWKMIRSRDYRYVAHADGREVLYALNAAWGEYRDVSKDPIHSDALAEHRHLSIKRLIAMERPRTRIWGY